MATSPHTHDDVKLEILQTLVEIFLWHINFCRRKAFYRKGYDKIAELSDFKENLISRFIKLGNISVELGSQESLWRNGTLFCIPMVPEHSLQLSLKIFDDPFS